LRSKLVHEGTPALMHQQHTTPTRIRHRCGTTDATSVAKYHRI